MCVRACVCVQVPICMYLNVHVNKSDTYQINIISLIVIICLYFSFMYSWIFLEVVRVMTHIIDQGWAMYWGTACWTPREIMEAYTNCRQFNCITPIVEQTEYHMFCREKTEVYMPETCNKIGESSICASEVSIGTNRRVSLQG